MPAKLDESTPGVKALKIFRKLLVDGGKHYQSDLADEFNCSPQTIIRVMVDIESVTGINLETGLDNRRRWYRLKSKIPIGEESREVRYLSICRDIAAPGLEPAEISRMDDTIFNLSMQIAEQMRGYNGRTPSINFFSKGIIDYRPYMPVIESLSQAIERRRVCQIVYKKPGKKMQTNYWFAADQFISMSQTLYAAGAILEDDCKTVRHYCTLPVQRIKGCRFTGNIHQLSFPTLDAASFGLPWHEPRLFKICFKAGKAADYVEERIWSAGQKIEYNIDGSLNLEFVSRSQPEVDAWVRSFGDQVKSYEVIANVLESGQDFSDENL